MFCINCLLLITMSSNPDGLVNNPASRIPEWSRPGRCGTNSLFVLLRLMVESKALTEEVTYSDVVRELPPENDKGCSIADIQDAAHRLGIEGEVRKIALRDISRVRTPFIAHLDMLDRGSQGHFITVYKFFKNNDKTYMFFVDGTTGQLHNAELEGMEGALTGFAFLPTSTPRDTRGLAPWFVGLNGIFIGAMGGWSLVRRREGREP